MTRYLHTMYRITDPEQEPRASTRRSASSSGARWTSSATASTEATNYFFGVPGQDEELELTVQPRRAHATSSARRTGTSRSASTTSTATLAQLAEQGIEARARAVPGARGRLAALCFVQGPGRATGSS